jgi:hypothetical protein
MMGEMPFIDYLNAVDDLLEARFGITSNDVDTASRPSTYTKAL